MTSHSQQCLDLLNLKKGFDLSDALTSLSHWLPGTDCCGWEGVSCDEASGLVVSLDLSERYMGGNIMPSLFNLTSLQTLNLAYNDFNQLSAVLLSDLEKMANLTHLNLSYSGIFGQVPMGISRLTKLISLDLSSDIYPFKLEKPDLGTLIRNLSNLKELYLDYVNVSSSRTEWCQAISHSAPGLEALSLIHCSLSGPIDSSFSKLRNLSILRLNSNNLLSQVPDFFANFSSLTELSLSSCRLKGLFPRSMFELLNLKTLDLSFNPMLAGFLPEFLLNSSLEALTISNTNFSGSLPNSLRNLKSLTSLYLDGCNFSGPIPLSIWNLSQLTDLDLSYNHFSGELPPMPASSKISTLLLSYNNFTGLISNTFDSAQQLVSLHLDGNSLTGSIPVSLFTLPILEELILSNNNLSGQLQEFTNASSTLQFVDLGGNNLQGKLPKSLVHLSALVSLYLSSNNFDDSVLELELFGHLPSLESLDLSGINLLISNQIADSSRLFPSLNGLNLKSCNLTAIPSFLKHKKNMNYLYLSNNRINGSIPKWIWGIGSFSWTMDLSFNSFTDIEMPFLMHSSNVYSLDLSSNRIGGTLPSWIWSSTLYYLNLSCNSLTGVERSFSIPPTNVVYIDLHSNLLQGPIPLPPPTSVIVDYSNNLFTSSIPFNISYYLNKTRFFSLSNNSLTGEVPSSICSATKLYLFDISHNNLSGLIPACLLESLVDLRVLNARENSFQGNIPQKVSSRCALQTINLHGNKLEGLVPSSWANCAELEVLDLGRNKLGDSFPYWSMNLPALKVLVLKENRFFGHLTGICEGNHFMMLQIFDISSNRYTGSFSSDCFKSMKAMMVHQGPTETIGYTNDSLVTSSYRDIVTVNLKGLEIELVKILTTFTSIDLSNNRFVGNIPQVLGDLKSLHALNMSLNAFTGEIPQALGDMIELEALDLSGNQLSGVIPSSLTSLYFLAFLNLSNNNLVGRIPQSNQFSTFLNSSFEGNPGLCGNPLSRDCINSTSVEPSSNSTNAPTEFDVDKIWFWMFTGLGYGVGFASVIIYQLFFPKWKMWYKRRFMNR
ncbi:receptor-like protein 43 [Dioscorea cayenensis subsp. rotundata]|uniref:Receptor-like protein 43 n=1 Tax=Dioscorea cayennensis subsp. rotundata TaxID=55577 RepID=A0AB40AU04_DIOCR|nr:receptor-like protein 43 [Dioscorea cayenensis subsp. rotundata]